MTETIALWLFFAVWVLFALIGFYMRKNVIISVGGGFLATCAGLVGVSSVYSGYLWWGENQSQINEWFILAQISGVYIFPYLVALVRRHHQRNAIFVLNLLLGWTVLGWVIALVWSMTAVHRQHSHVAN